MAMVSLYSNRALTKTVPEDDTEGKSPSQCKAREKGKGEGEGSTLARSVSGGVQKVPWDHGPLTTHLYAPQTEDSRSAQQGASLQET